MKILHVVGARPNFMKAAPVMTALNGHVGVEQKLVHTGQHYDANMSEIFFRELGLPDPDINLNVGSGSHSWQVAHIMLAFEPVVASIAPDIALVYGDVNSTLACALVSVKLQIPVGHVEAGLRSLDRSMPEEINRILTDQICELLFTPSADADQNLSHEGISAGKIHLVGNVMIDTLVRLLPQANSRVEHLAQRYGLGEAYGLVTIHRPSNVDDPRRLTALIETLAEISQLIPLIFPVHPRTKARIREQILDGAGSSLRFVEPQSYLDFLALMHKANLVITDSGGIQEETTYLGVPCFTLRKNTERPITLQMGTNHLVGDDLNDLYREVYQQIQNGCPPIYQIPPLWDGRAGERIADILLKS
jgi:UDP-N-acetylglucosamine 2-epimerase (non-hydrolysing)